MKLFKKLVFWPDKQRYIPSILPAVKQPTFKTGQKVYVTDDGDVWEGTFKTMTSDGKCIVDTKYDLVHVPLSQVTAMPEEAING